MVKKDVNFGDMISGGFIGFILGSIVYLIVKTLIEKTTDIIALFAFIAGCVAAYIALKQFYQNAQKNESDREWNTKYLAYTQINEHIKHLEEKRTLLDELTIEHNLINSGNEFISFSDIRNVKKQLHYEDIHNWICKKDSNNNRIISKVIDNKNIYATTVYGAEILRAIISIINTYELISTGVKLKLLEEELVFELLDDSIYSNYYFFENYIKHKREKHEANDFACNWEYIYLEIKKRKDIKSLLLP